MNGRVINRGSRLPTYPPPEEIQEFVLGNRGVWMPTAEVESDRFLQAKLRVQADGAEDRWARGPQLALPVVGALKDLGVAQGLGKPAKDLQAAKARTACDWWPGSGFQGSP